MRKAGRRKNCMIEISGLYKVFNEGKPNEKIALENVNLSVGDGEMIAITGASGAGKSTLLNILGTLDFATKGNVAADDLTLSAMTPKELAKYRGEKVGIVTQYPFLIEGVSAKDNVSVPLLNGKIKRQEREKRCAEMLDSLGLSEFANTDVSVMSGGERQRVAIARALINNPSLILADEPTGALDKANSEKILEIFFKLNRMGKTVIMVTHNEEIAKKCARNVVISDGKIISDTVNG